MIHGRNLYMIACVDRDGGLGKEGTIPWHAPKDLRQFRAQTTTTTDPTKQHMVIMGATTYQSLPTSFRPLPKRKNVVLSRSLTELPGAEVAHTFAEAWEQITEDVEDVYIIGGAQIYAQAMTFPELDGIWLTKLSESYICDVFFPKIPEGWSSSLQDHWEDETLQGEYLYYTPNKK